MMNPEQISQALNDGKMISFAGGTHWAKKSSVDDVVYLGCYSPEDCCQDECRSVGEFMALYKPELEGAEIE